MSTVPNLENEPLVLSESAGIMVSEGIENLKNRSRSNRKKRIIGDEVDRQRMIADNAYYRAERRGFNGGYEIQDWLEAEAEIDGSI